MAKRKENFRFRYAETEEKFIVTFLLGDSPQECHRCSSLREVFEYLQYWIEGFQLAQETFHVKYS